MLLLLLLLLLLRQVLEAEASSPLVTAQHLQDAGQMPCVLVQGTAGGLVATPAAAERQDMYHKETEYTGAAFFQAAVLLQVGFHWKLSNNASFRPRQEMYHNETEYTGACVTVSEAVACCFERSNGLKVSSS
jgi:hypothetical protein